MYFYIQFLKAKKLPIKKHLPTLSTAIKKSPVYYYCAGFLFAGSFFTQGSVLPPHPPTCPSLSFPTLELSSPLPGCYSALPET